jgi:hypothetical protein
LKIISDARETVPALFFEVHKQNNPGANSQYSSHLAIPAYIYLQPTEYLGRLGGPSAVARGAKNKLSNAPMKVAEMQRVEGKAHLKKYTEKKEQNTSSADVDRPP